MAGLFPSQDAVAIAEAQQRAASDPRAVLRGSLFNLGQAGGGAITRGFGGDSRSPQQQRAAGLQDIARTVDFNDPESIMAGANAMNQAGFQDAGMQLLTLLPESADAAETFHEEWRQIGGKTILVNVSDQSGKVSSIAENKPTGGDGPGDDRLGQLRYTDQGIVIPEQQMPFLESILSQDQAFANEMFGNVDFDSDGGQAVLKGLTGMLFQNVAERKSQLINDIEVPYLQAMSQLGRTGNPATERQRNILQAELDLAIRKGVPQDAELVRSALQDLRGSGALEKMVADNITDDTIDFSGRIASDLENQQAADFRAERARQVAAVEQQAGQVQRPFIPVRDVFAIRHLDGPAVADVFNGVTRGTDADQIERIVGADFSMPEDIGFHQSRWSMMRAPENVQPVAEAVELMRSDPVAARNHLSKASSAAYNAGNGTSAQQLILINQYFDTFLKSPKASGRGRSPLGN